MIKLRVMIIDRRMTRSLHAPTVDGITDIQGVRMRQAARKVYAALEGYGVDVVLIFVGRGPPTSVVFIGFSPGWVIFAHFYAHF